VLELIRGPAEPARIICLLVAHWNPISSGLEVVRVLLCWGEDHFGLVDDDGIIHEKGLEKAFHHVFEFVIHEILWLIEGLPIWVEELLEDVLVGRDHVGVVEEEEDLDEEVVYQPHRDFLEVVNGERGKV
jgi:hypothetical protein